MKIQSVWTSSTSEPSRLPAGWWATAIILALACQGGQTGPVGPGSDDPNQLDSLTITTAPKLAVHENTILRAKAWKGRLEVPDSTTVWRSLDPQIATVTTSGVANTWQTGTARITATSGNVADTVSLTVYPMLRIISDLFVDLVNGLPMAVEDHIQLAVLAVDIDGQPLPNVQPSVTWTSSDPGAVSVDGSGAVTTHRPAGRVIVQATSPDDAVAIEIKVLDVPAGQPATVRLVHGIAGLGTVTFHMSQGGDVSLTYGQSVEVPIVSGTFQVSTGGLPPPRGNVYADPSGDFLGVVNPNDHLSLYAVGSNTQGGYLAPAWPTTDPVPSDSILVRLVQSSPAMVVYLRPPGAPRTGLPEFCYFDPATVAPYLEMPAADFDIIGQDKYGQQEEIGRTTASAAGGHAVTMVLTGGAGQPLGVMTFVDY